MNPSWLLTTDDSPSVAPVGGKASGLYKLLSLGLRVPPFVALTAEAYRFSCPGGNVPETLPGEVESLLDSVWEKMGSGSVPLAVRSSGVEEDGAERSYAGQMDTFLGIRRREALSEAVLGCWKSLHGRRATAYRAAGSPVNVPASLGGGPDSAMAVVIQEMISPDAAGVLFTVNPISGRQDELLVSSVWGLGEGLVSGVLDADTFVLDREGSVKSSQIAIKAEKVVALESGSTERQALTAKESVKSSLEAGTLGELARLSLMAEKAAGYPLDIEFALADGKIFFLQARPVTGFVPRAKEDEGLRQVWDNSNIIESYPGITTPLTFSFIRRAYKAVYWQFCQVLGLSEKEISRHEDMLANMLGLIRGRVYYNLLNWYRLVSLLPGFSYNKEFMEGMMGLKNPEELEQKTLSWKERYFRELPRLVRAGIRAVRLQLSLSGHIKRFHADFDRSHKYFSSIGYEELTPSEVIEHYLHMEQEVLWRWKAPIINDFSAMIFYGLLKKLTVNWEVDQDSSIQNALISRQGNIESIQVIERLQEVTDLIARDESLKQDFIKASPPDALGMIRDNQALVSAFDEYLNIYGDRCLEELKLESRTMKDDPDFCVAMMQNILRQTAVETDAETISQKALGDRAQEELVRRLRRKFTRFGIPKLTVYRWVLKHARAAIKNRENQRLARTRAFAVARRMFRSIGHYFYLRKMIDAPEDIFYIELPEIIGHVTQHDRDVNFRALAHKRRQKYERFSQMPAPPDHFITYGAEEEGPPVTEGAEPETSMRAFHGLGACPGIVERPAMLLLKPDTSVRLDGQILVTHQTDPGWVLLFPSISGLVVERGSMLSHSAIVAREMGIPAVVGVGGACRNIKTGDLLRIDGSKGSVEILEAQGEYR